MKLSLNWIREYVELPEELTPEKISYDLTMSTVEVEEVIDLGAEFQEMYVGRVTEVKKHPEADRLVICLTDLGSKFGVKEIVCGGSNLVAGMAVAVAVPGAMVNWHGEAEKTELKLAKIRGVESFGMICGASEIGLSDLYPAEDEKEIVDLQDPDVEAGIPLADYLGYNDLIIDIDNKSLTHRPDLWGHYGIARELAAIYKSTLKPLPEFSLDGVSEDGPINVDIQNTDLCYRFTATVVKNVKNGIAPLWMRARLASVGQRPINFLADITNYVMFAMGKPSHAFDLSKIASGQLNIRDSEGKEKLQLLDGRELELEDRTLVVADSSGPLGLAGVMGGESSGVLEDTTEIVFESANFNPGYVRRTATKYDARTESSARFEKGIDTDSTIYSQHMLLSILKDIQGEIEVVQFQDRFPVPPSEVKIDTTVQFISSRIGAELSGEEISEVLNRLGFTVELSGEEISVTVPAWRATGDVSLPEDLVEEVARIYGYDNLESAPVQIEISSSIQQSWYETDRSIREYLAYKGGLQEVFTYPWVDEKLIEACGQQELSSFELGSPPSPQTARLKNCLVPSLLGLVKKNLRFYDQFGLYEISQVYPSESYTEQPKLLCALSVGKDPKEVFLKQKGVLEGMLDSLGISYSLEQDNDPPVWLNSKAALQIKLGNDSLGGGYFGLVSKRTAKKIGAGRFHVAIFLLPLADLYAQPKATISYKPIPKFPTIEYDLAVLFDSGTKWGEISSLVGSGDDLIKEVVFVDEYSGKQIPEGKKSVAFKLVLGDDNATLTSKQADAVAAKTLKSLQSKLGGELRTS